MRYQFCPKCGGHLSADLTGDVNRPKCEACGFIFYQNPAVGVAAIVIESRKVLLGRRKASYKGMWCIPCGYVEYSEDVRESLVREMKEETGLDVTLGRVFEVYSNFHNPNQHTVGLWFLTEEVKGEAVAMDDLDEVRYFTFEEIASNGLVLAFPTDKRVIEALKIQNMID